MSMLDTLRFDLAQRWRPIMRVVGVAAVVALVIPAVVAGVVYWQAESGRTDEGALGTQVPLEDYTVGALQVFDCLRVGPEACAEHEDAMAYLVESAPSDGLVYTPLEASDPGTDRGDGTRALVLSTATTPGEWQALGRAVTLDGRATPGSVPASSVTTLDVATTSFTVAATPQAPAMRGTARFTLVSAGVSLAEITYVAG